MKLSIKHLELLMDLRGSVRKYNLLSSTKVKLAPDLVYLGLLKVDKEDYIFLAERGDNILDYTVETFNKAANTP